MKFRPRNEAGGFSLFYAALCLGFLTVFTPAASGHLLNKTIIVVEIDQNAGDIRILVKADLTRILNGPRPYYELTTLPPEAQKERLDPILNRILAGMHFNYGAARLAPQFVSASLPKLKSERFFSPMAAPMTQIQLVEKLPQNEAAFSFHTDPEIPVEMPIVLTIKTIGENRRITRWLQGGQKIEPFTLQPVRLTEAETEAGQATEASGSKPPKPQEAVMGWVFLAGQYLELGFTHIIPGGLDHILFVVGLFLLAIRWKPLLAQVTCFTLAHSITLAVAVLDIFTLPSSLIEPLIALSIVYVGLENILRANLSKTRLAVVFLFGLLHGMGFANVLLELEISGRELVPSLLFFNIGVELGQIAVLCAAFCAVGWFRNWLHFKKAILIPGSAIISLVALFWTLQRLSLI